jgi:hypothetical protein
MAVTFIAAAKTPTSFPGSNNTSTCNIAKPTGTLDGHLMIAIIQSGGGVAISAPGGWTLADEYDHAGGANLTNSIYWKIASSEGSSYTFTDDSGDATPMCGAILTWSGTHTTAPINVVSDAESAGTDTKSTPSATTTERCLMLHVRVGKTSTVASQGTFAAVANYTDRVAFANRGDGTQYFVEALSLTAATIVNAGSQAGISFNADHVLTGSIERQIGIREDTPATNAPATVASATATAYAPASLTSSTTSGFSAATATAHNASVLTGVAAENVPQASATATAYDAMGWVIHPVDVGAIAFNATVAITTDAEHATATVSVGNAVGYYGAPASRRWTIAAESRTWTIESESRVYRTEA